MQYVVLQSAIVSQGLPALPSLHSFDTHEKPG
jgi:hypothetical protein